MLSKPVQVYEIIQKKASSNTAMQALSGLAGFPFTVMVDTAVFFSHYGPMLNEIRGVYGRPEVCISSLAPVLKGCKGELLSDFVLDKIIGNIPLIGMPANMICARALTWRLGLVFGMLASRGDEIEEDSVARAVTLIRTMFPQRESIFFKKPGIDLVEKLLNSVEGDSFETFDRKISRILDGLAE